MKPAYIITAVCVFVLVMTMAGALLAQSWATARQADAVVMAASGQAAASVALAFVFGVLVVLLCAVVGLMWWRTVVTRSRLYRFDALPELEQRAIAAAHARRVRGIASVEDMDKLEAFEEPSMFELPAGWWK